MFYIRNQSFLHYQQTLSLIFQFFESGGVNFSESTVLEIIQSGKMQYIKNDNIKNGLGQCIAEMLAAQLFNQQEQNEIQIVYGVVTTGTIWQFLKLKDKTVEIDLKEYHLPEIDKILGILRMSLNQANS